MKIPLIINDAHLAFVATLAQGNILDELKVLPNEFFEVCDALVTHHCNRSTSGACSVEFRGRRGVVAVGDFKRHIYSSILRSVTLEQLARECGMSLTMFKSTFRHYFNAPPHRWIVVYRLYVAQQLLLVTNESVKTICYRCGFCSPSHLIRCFRREFGITPSRYRPRYGINRRVEDKERVEGKEKVPPKLRVEEFEGTAV